MSFGNIIRKAGHDGNDYYPTPPHATYALLEYERTWITRSLAVTGSYVWEPACGRGWMAREIMKQYPVIASDLVIYDDPLIPIIHEIDFLTGTPPKNFGAIITNPPYGRGLAEKFARHALSMSPYVAMLCRATWAESVERYDFFKIMPPSRVLFFSKRFSCSEDLFGTGKENGGMVSYAWWIWDAMRAREAKMDWIDPNVYERWKGNGSA